MIPFVTMSMSFLPMSRSGLFRYPTIFDILIWRRRGWSRLRGCWGRVGPLRGRGCVRRLWSGFGFTTAPTTEAVIFVVNIRVEAVGFDPDIGWILPRNTHGHFVMIRGQRSWHHWRLGFTSFFNFNRRRNERGCFEIIFTDLRLEWRRLCWCYWFLRAWSLFSFIFLL